MTPLRCLLFTSSKELVEPIWQVLADLGIERDHCESAVDAVEKVTTQMFQIVITDWDDQPEATFLLKTARDLKAAARPLTLAIVSDDARRPEALQAGANSILLKPIRAEQVRDTMSTACELLRSKLQAAAPVSTHPPAGTAAFAVAASGNSILMPASVTKAPEKLRAGEFLQTPNSMPGAQFDTESEFKNAEEPAISQVQPDAQLEPTASALEASSTQPAVPPETLTGWSMLQAKLTQSAPRKAAGTPGKNEWLTYGDASSKPSSEISFTGETSVVRKKELPSDSESESALFDYISDKRENDGEPAGQSRPGRGKILLIAAAAVLCIGLASMPRFRPRLQSIYRNWARTGSRLLNPPPPPLPEAVAAHDSFGQSGDEYKLPTPVNIPDATTDPAQIRVLPVVDPTAKQTKNAENNAGQEPAPPIDNVSTQPDQAAGGQNVQGSNLEIEVKAATPSGVGSVKDGPAAASSDVVRGQILPSVPLVQAVAPRPVPQSNYAAPTHALSASVSAGIPSSLKSQIASSTPLSSGSKPVEAAMSSIEPVNLPETEARALLTHPIDPEYPASAKSSGQRGSVALQVLIGRDGTVLDAKFLQGSLVFARVSIDAVKQWRFKPYSFNGRSVSVQTVITLNFRPPA
jgi:TonB family protein